MATSGWTPTLPAVAHNDSAFMSLSRQAAELVIIAGSGPSLTRAVAEQCGSASVIAVNDAWRLFSHAILYAADFTWWRHHAEDLKAFRGRRITCRADVNGPVDIEQLKAWGIEILKIDPGQCSGYGAITTALYLGFKKLLLVGYDMRVVAGRRHFFGDHDGLRNTDDYSFALPDFDRLAREIPRDVTVLNATPCSALRAFPFTTLEQLSDDRTNTE